MYCIHIPHMCAAGPTVYVTGIQRLRWFYCGSTVAISWEWLVNMLENGESAASYAEEN